MPARAALRSLARSLRSRRAPLTPAFACTAPVTASLHYSTTTTTPSSPPLSSSAAATHVPAPKVAAAAARRARAVPPRVLDLGNNITVELPRRTNHAEERRTLNKKKQKKRHSQRGGSQPSRRPLYAANPPSESPSQRPPATEEEEKEPGKSLTAQDASRPDTTLTDNYAEGHLSLSRTAEEMSLAAATGVKDAFRLPLNGAEAAACIDCGTLLEALAVPDSAAIMESSSPAPARAHASHTMAVSRHSADAAQQTVHELTTTALPLLFRVAGQLAESAGGSAPSAAAAVDVAQLTAAVAVLSSHLENMQRATRCDGRRHVPALPPSVVAALWDSVLPCLHQLSLADTSPGTATQSGTKEMGKAKGKGHVALSDSATERREGDETRKQANAAVELLEGQEGTPVPSVEMQRSEAHRKTEEPTQETSSSSSAASSSLSSTRVTTLSAVNATPSPPLTPQRQQAKLKASYLSTRRSLALHTRAICSLFPPDALAMVLTRMFQCGALADDVLGPIVSELAAPYDPAAQRHATPHAPTSQTADSVGGTIDILRHRVLRLPPDSSSVDSFRGAAAITVARLLGKAAIPGHHQLHRFFHLALLPEVTRVLAATATTAVRALRAMEEKEEKKTEKEHRHNAAGVPSHGTPDARPQGETSSRRGVVRSGDGATTSADAAALATIQPGTEALLDLTAAFRHYAVSGAAVSHLTTLWQVQLLRGRAATLPDIHSSSPTPVEAEAWRNCAALLTALSTLPAASSKTQRRQARRISTTRATDGAGGGGRGGSAVDARLMRVAEEEYYPLVDLACAQLQHLSSIAAATAAAAAAAPSPEMTVALSTPQLLSMLRMLLRLNSPTWAETYDALATLLFTTLSLQLRGSTVAAVVGPGGGPSQDALERIFSLDDTRRTVTALLRRNTLIPDHPLHRVLLRRLLYAPEALSDAAVAGTALIALEAMIAPSEGSEMPAPPTAAAAAAVRDGEANDRSSGGRTPTPREDGAHAAGEEGAGSALALAEAHFRDATAITAQDRLRALEVLRKRGRSVNPTAFVSGLCVAPIHRLSLPQQVALVNYFTSVVSAVAPTLVVKGMTALAAQLPPRALDDVSVQQWYSRFTARDVVRRVDAAGCAALLELLASNENYERNAALAKETITRRLGTLLRHAGDDEDGGDGVGSGQSAVSPPPLTLDELPRVVAALRHAHVFFPPYFSRVCRMLLGQVERAPLCDLLTPFAAVAEEFMHRSQREAQASVFKDVWELLRGRLLEQAERLSLDEACVALNAFAALDVKDRALFGVLVYQLWRCVETALAEQTSAGGSEEDGVALEKKRTTTTTSSSSHDAVDDDGSVVEQEVSLAGAEDTDRDHSSPLPDEELLSAAHRHAQMGQRITHALSPSAVAVVVATLCARDAALATTATRSSGDHSSPSAEPQQSSGQDAMVRTLLPWMLLALRRCHTELYPIDVVHLLPVLVQRYAAAAVTEPPSCPSVERQSALVEGAAEAQLLLHAAYDACRTTFLSMYAALPPLPEKQLTSSESGHSGAADTQSQADADGACLMEGSTLSRAVQRGIAEQRAEWTAAVKLSVQVVPGSWFAALLLSLSSANLADVDVGLACVSKACTRRVCSSQLPIDELVDLCLTMCWLFRLSDYTTAHDIGRQVEGEVEARKEPPAHATGGDADRSASAPHAGTSNTNAAFVCGILRPAMSTVLSALWHRCEELTVSHIHALLRCLRATYGETRVDADFTERLEAQKALIMQRRDTSRAAAAVAPPSESTSQAPPAAEEAAVVSDGDDDASLLKAEVGGTATGRAADARDDSSAVRHDARLSTFSESDPAASSRPPPPPPAEQMSADDLFSMM